MTNLPVFFTSAEASVARESMILAHTPFFSSCSSAMAAAIAPLGIALTTFLLLFMAFIGAIAMKCYEMVERKHRKLTAVH